MGNTCETGFSGSVLNLNVYNLFTGVSIETKHSFNPQTHVDRGKPVGQLNYSIPCLMRILAVPPSAVLIWVLGFPYTGFHIFKE